MCAFICKTAKFINQQDFVFISKFVHIDAKSFSIEQSFHMNGKN